MRQTPLKAGSLLRRALITIRMREIDLRMREVYGNPDVWFLDSPKPTNGSPWEQTQTHGRSFAKVGQVSVSLLTKLEGDLRIEAVRDYFAGLRVVTRTQSVYSVYVMCRSTIEACAFAAWVFDPKVHAGERLRRGLALRKESLEGILKSIRDIESEHSGDLDSAYLPDTSDAKIEARRQLREVKRAIRGIRVGLESATHQPLDLSHKAPSTTRRVREMLFDDMDMPQGFDAYHRMSAVAHSEALGIIGTWNSDGGKPSIDYYDFLVYLHLALCSIDFCLERRAACWGATYEGSKLHKIIFRVENIIEGEPEVKLL